MAKLLEQQTNSAIPAGEISAGCGPSWYCVKIYLESFVRSVQQVEDEMCLSLSASIALRLTR